MKTKTVSPNRFFLRFSESSPRSSSIDDILATHFQKTRLRQSVGTQRMGNSELPPSTFTQLRSQLNHIKSQVNRLLEEGPINKDDEEQFDPTKSKNSTLTIDSSQYSDLRSTQNNRNLLLSTKTDQDSQNSLIDLSKLKRELKESLQRQKMLLAERKSYQDQIERYRLNIQKLHQQVEQKNLQLLKANTQLQQFIKSNFGKSHKQRRNSQEENQYLSRLVWVEKNNQNLAKEVEQLKSQRQTSISNFQQKIAKMNEKYNCYIRKMKETYEKELKQKMSCEEKEKTNTELLLKEKSLEGSSDKIVQEIINRLNKQIKRRDKKIELMFMEIIRLQKQHKQSMSLKEKFDKQVRLIEELNCQIFREKAKKLSQKYGEI